MTGYSEFNTQISNFKKFAENKKIRYFKSNWQAAFSIEYEHHKMVVPALLALILATFERRFDVEFQAASGGYGCFKVSYTVVAETREEAEAIADFMKSSKIVKRLTSQSVSEQLLIQSLTSNQAARDALRIADRSSIQVEDHKEAIQTIDAAIGVVEDELGLVPKENATLDDRLAKLDENAVKSLPPPESSFWRLGDLVGALVGGFAKSMGS